MSRPLAFVHGAFGRLGLVDMDSDLATHAHHHLHVVIKTGGADTRFRVRGATHPVADDSAVLVNAWEPHAWRRQPGAPPTRFLTLYLEPDWLAAAGLDAQAGGFGSFFPAPCVRLSDAARRSVRAVAEIMAASASLPAASTGGGPIGTQIGAALPALIDELRGAARRRAGLAQGLAPFDYRIRRALDLLRASEAPSRLDAVAREVGLSRPRFFELFQECTGLTPSRVVNAARMERAIGVMADDRGSHRASMGALALELGFATPGNFSRFFRQQIGVSPRAFRRAMVAADAP